MEEISYNEIAIILNLLKSKRGFDFTGNKHSMLERRIKKRLLATKTKTYKDYHLFINENPKELDKLIDVLTINVSSFFRDPIVFEYFSSKILPTLVVEKLKKKDKSIRIWSAGCSSGEEPYSIAIELKEYFKKESLNFDVSIFATEIDNKSLKTAIDGKYSYDRIKNIRVDYLNKYFNVKDDLYILKNEIKKMVQFSFFDILDKKYLVPPESIFGDFDIVFCRNVLIYFDYNYQEIIFTKLYKSLNSKGYLIFGEAEAPIEKFINEFNKENAYFKIYRKNEY
ncbi:MAG: protein-glutamate O-methyltransferase CheR [Bacteroidales bacterium]|nr:protein-glutamate O-methyltransferase CheR [Bacteroidales bacterium]